MEKWEQIARESLSKEFEAFKRSLVGGRRPDSVEFTNIEGDVKRRDLTINALFYDIDTHEIVDLVGGVSDLRNGIVRTVGQPEDRFGEDRLRIMRAIRFAGRFGNQLDQATDLALQKDSSLEGISAERIRDEFIKGLKSAKSTKHFISLLDKYKLFNWIFKGFNVDLSKVSDKDTDYIVLIASILKNNNLDVLRKTLNKLTYSVDEIKGISFLIALLKLDIETAVILKKAQEHSSLSNEQIKMFGLKNNIDRRLLDAFLSFRLTVSGAEVMDEFGLKPSPELGAKIQQIETENFKKLIK